MTPPVIIVSGLPRSGTSLMMSILAAAGIPVFTDRVRTADADNPRGYFEHDAAKTLARDHSWLPQAAGHALKLVVPLIDHLPAALPARVLLMERNLDEILASQAAMLSRSGRPAAPAAVLRPVFEKMWSQSREFLEKSAPTVQTMIVPHRALIGTPETLLPRIAGFLAHPFDVAALRAIIDPALHRQRASPSA